MDASPIPSERVSKFTTNDKGKRMLILSRKMEERIIIDNDIVIMVVAIQRDKVRLGIEAPKGVRVDREEVWKARQAENENEKSNS